MKIGFSTLALFMNSFEYFLEIASNGGFQLMEILCEGPYWPRNMIANSGNLEIFDSYDIDIFLHAPTIDINPASLNPGIREESQRQMKETSDFAALIGAKAITTHPGMIQRQEERVRNFAIKHAIVNLTECADYAQSRGIFFSIENMPYRYKYLCNTALEHEFFVKKCGCMATVDMGHANTTTHPAEFLKIKNTYYYHLSDNNGEKDQHLSLGEGNLDLSLLKGIKRGIIELNNYDAVLKSKKILDALNGNEIN
ncbi:sugar phosphate isomerase/epimerase family protein [Methanobacterium alcaliphilum]|uniref:sugar phosphate isomerase/epimerase family protein n=1 Tax=Methanobacterium alcaliphilum TaxID=392018 RepID=UPI00200B9A08|nr:sugar phosphate isomerase/epimerase [Methanobacterium alcaliphilum]MCK9152356.1 sugar phosphate isomerase/epimerase [Methanobacterium alcaliphilum]